MTDGTFGQQHRRLLVLLGAACFSEGFDFATLTVALPQIRHSFGLAHAHADYWVAVLYLGALPAVLWGRRADRHGRRGVLLAAIVGYTFSSVATAASVNVQMFVTCQFVTRCFLATQVAMAWTMAAEDLPAHRRGSGFGVLALSSALGTGFSAIVQAVALAPMHASWRWLYVLALPFLLVVLVLSRSLPESTRYRTLAAQRARSGPKGGIAPLLRPPYRSQLWLVCVMMLLANLTTEPTVFAVDFMQTQRHLSSSEANLLLVAAGAVALPVLTLAGRASDAIGRRRVCMTGLVVQAAGMLLFFVVARGAAPLGLALCVAYLGLFAAWTTGNAFAVEMFPTSLRGAASATSSMAKLLGQSASFAVAGLLLSATHRTSATVGVLLTGPVLAAFLIGGFLPETSRRELTDLAAPAAPAGMRMSSAGRTLSPPAPHADMLLAVPDPDE